MTEWVGEFGNGCYCKKKKRPTNMELGKQGTKGNMVVMIAEEDVRTTTISGNLDARSFDI